MNQSIRKFLILSVFLLLPLILSQGSEARRNSRRTGRARGDKNLARPRISDMQKLEGMIKEDGYYDEASDKRNATIFYQNIFSNLTRNLNYESLNELLSKTHERVYSYNVARAQFLYPIVDRHRNNSLVCVYTRTVLADRERQYGSFNCEHTVPQSWFNKRTPMVSDLHHLYASLDSCNNFRSNYIFGDYFDNKDQRAQKLEKPGCGITFSQNASDQRNPSVVGFEAYAKEGRGATARSTLYFFVRYPGIIKRSLIPERNLREIIQMAKAIPVLEWERHRNAAIYIAQGNRNPFIDHTEWIDRVDFSKGYSDF